MRSGAGPVFAALSNRGLQLLGVISYSLYLMHFPVIFGLGAVLLQIGFLGADSKLWAAAVYFSAALALPIALSTVSYGVVERPFLLRKQNMAP